MSKKILRLGADEMPADLAEQLAPRIQRLGYLGEFFQVMAHQPQVLSTFITLTEQLKEAVPRKLTEVVALTIAQKAGNDYEKNQHDRLCEKLGYERAWIEAVLALDPSSSVLAPEEAITQELALAAIESLGKNCAAPFEKLVDTAGHHQALGILMLIGRYLTHAIIVNTLELKPPVPSIFESTAEEDPE